jgi:hypothetical protein
MKVKNKSRIKINSELDNIKIVWGNDFYNLDPLQKADLLKDLLHLVEEEYNLAVTDFNEVLRKISKS